MATGTIKAESIAPDMISGVFTETQDHITLGAELSVVTGSAPETATSLAALPVGTKIFVKSKVEARKADPTYDEVGIILGHDKDKVNVLTLAPKGTDEQWSTHNAYGNGGSSEILDAMAALDRLFDPTTEFGSIAVLSEATGMLLGERVSGSVGTAGCNSHERASLGSTLRLSQLLDTYRLGSYKLKPDAGLVRRAPDHTIICALPSEQFGQGPTREMRDQRSMYDRIHRLTQEDDSQLSGLTPASVLRGLETAVSSGAFTDLDKPVSAVSQVIRQGAEGLVL